MKNGNCLKCTETARKGFKAVAVLFLLVCYCGCTRFKVWQTSFDSDLKYCDAMPYGLKSRPSKKFAIVRVRPDGLGTPGNCAAGHEPRLALVVSGTPNVPCLFFVDEKYWKYNRRPAGDGVWVLAEIIYSEYASRDLRSRIYRREVYVPAHEKRSVLENITGFGRRSCPNADGGHVEGAFDLNPLFKKHPGLDFVCLIVDGNRTVELKDMEGKRGVAIPLGVTSEEWPVMASMSATWPGFFQGCSERPELEDEILVEADTLPELLSQPLRSRMPENINE